MATLTKVKTRQFTVKNLKGKKFTEKFYDEPFEVMDSNGDLYDPRLYFNDTNYNDNPYDIEVDF